MGQFEYRARDEKGSLITGTLDVDSKSAALSQIDRMGLLPLSVKEAGAGMFSRDAILSLFSKVKAEDIIFLTRQMQTVIRSGIPIHKGLRALQEQTQNNALRTALVEISRDVDRGHRLSDSLGKHKRIFSETYVSMVAAGEESGTLEEVLGRLANLIEFQLKTREMVKSALRYPLLVICALLGAFIVIVRVVIPKFAPIFASSKMELPLPTRIILFINQVSQSYGGYVVAGVILLVILFIFYRKSLTGKTVTDKIALDIPIIGPILLKICMARFAYMFENLVRTGLPIVHSMGIIARTVGNYYIMNKIMEISSKIEKGQSLSISMREANVFPPLVVHLVTTGEDTGSLEEMLREISSHYDLEVQYSVGRLSSWIEPIITVGLGCMVLFLALGLFLPWWNMMSALKGGG